MRYIAMGMPKISIKRYSATGGTESAPPVGKYWAGYVEPEDKRWILYIQEDGTPFFFGSRDPETGACTEPPISVRVNGNECTSRHSMGDEVRMEFNPTLGKFLLGTIAAVKFTEYGKVLYDVKFEVPDLSGETPGGCTIIENVDSVFLSPVEDIAARVKYPVRQESSTVESKVTSATFVTKAQAKPVRMGVDDTDALKLAEVRARPSQANFDLEKLGKALPGQFGDLLKEASEGREVPVRALPAPDGEPEPCSGLPS